jgi:hypothetical protein
VNEFFWFRSEFSAFGFRPKILRLLGRPRNREAYFLNSTATVVSTTAGSPLMR